MRLRRPAMAAILDRLYHLHWVTPELARSAQPYLGLYGAFLRPHQFKSLINLRGENAGSRWWRTETRAADRLGIRHFDVKLSSRNLPSRNNLIALMDAFAVAEAPLLVKCSGGQDRTSLAAALYLLRCGGPGALAAAQRQFALWPYLHRPKRVQRWLRQLPQYFAETAEGVPVSEWVRLRYSPEDFAAWLRQRGMSRSYGALQAAE
jgi:protein tyrosine/serine phosphatase